MSLTSKRINGLARRFNFKNYLEIGVFKGDTFLNVTMPDKTAVDPHFEFDWRSQRAQSANYFAMTSNDFFSKFPQYLDKTPYLQPDGMPFKFDIIYIDGLHTFEQSYMDFLNSLPYSHARTIWIFDDTVPADPWAAIPDMEKSLNYRNLAKVASRTWQGDVFKTIFAIHDFQPYFSYATYVDAGNPQTIVWKNSRQREIRTAFGNLPAISNLSYFDFLDHYFLLAPMSENEALEMIGKDFNPDDLKDRASINQIVKPIKIKDINTINWKITRP